jgi:hypothetical protein
MFEMVVRETGWSNELNSAALRNGSLFNSHEHSNEILCTIKCGEILQQISYCQVLKHYSLL